MPSTDKSHSKGRKLTLSRRTLSILKGKNLPRHRCAPRRKNSAKKRKNSSLLIGSLFDGGREDVPATGCWWDGSLNAGDFGPGLPTDGSVREEKRGRRWREKKSSSTGPGLSFREFFHRKICERLCDSSRSARHGHKDTYGVTGRDSGRTSFHRKHSSRGFPIHIYTLLSFSLDFHGSQVRSHWLSISKIKPSPQRPLISHGIPEFVNQVD